MMSAVILPVWEKIPSPTLLLTEERSLNFVGAGKSKHCKNKTVNINTT